MLGLSGVAGEGVGGARVSGRFIGSGDIAAIVAFYRPELAHLAKWSNVSDLYMRLVLNITQPSTAILERGLRVEPITRQLYRDTIGPCTEAPGVQRHQVYQWGAASPDGYAEPSIVTEFKTASVWSVNQWGPSGTDEVPDKYNLQCQWLMGVTGRDVTHLLVAFGSDLGLDGQPEFAITETRVYELARSNELIAECEALAQRFCDEHVSAKIPPALKPVHNRRTWKALTNGAGYGGTKETSDEIGRGDGAH